MRILVHGMVGSNFGGIETFLLNMNDFMSQDCIFDYIIEEDECIHEERITKRGGKIFHVTSRSKNVRKHLHDIKKLYKECQETYEIIYYNLSSASWILPGLIARRMGYKVIVHSHNAMLIDMNNSYFYKIINAVNRQILGHSSVERLACSDLAAKFLFGNGDYTLIYNGIDVPKYKFSDDSRKNLRKKYKIDEESYVVGVVGRLAYQKNPLFGIEVFLEVLKRRPNSYMFMVGDGDLREEIKKKIRDSGINNRVILTGNISNVNDYLNMFDVFFLPSRHEGLGIALIEAQANGLPCITSENVVPKEVKVTELLQFLSLKKKAGAWADLIAENSRKMNCDKWNDLVKNSHYNICSEAKKLENILLK